MIEVVSLVWLSLASTFSFNLQILEMGLETEVTYSSLPMLFDVLMFSVSDAKKKASQARKLRAEVWISVL